MNDSPQQPEGGGIAESPGGAGWFAAKIFGVWMVVETIVAAPTIWLTPDIPYLLKRFAFVNIFVLLVWLLALADPRDSRNRRRRWLAVAAAVALAGTLGEWSGALAVMAWRPDLNDDVAGTFVVSVWAALLMAGVLLPAAYPSWRKIQLGKREKDNG